MFTLIKLIQPFFLPPMILLVLLVLVVLFWKRKRAWSKRFLIGALILYYVLSIEPTAFLLEKSLANRVVEVDLSQVVVEDIDAIVVLGAGASTKPSAELGGASWRRFWRGLEVYSELDGTVPIIYSGGSGDPFSTESGEAQLAKSYAIRVGVPEESFFIDSFSRDTYENSSEVLEILEEIDHSGSHLIILVTSATHMLRASMVIKAQGIDVLVVQADAGSQDIDIDALSFYPSPAWLGASTSSIHEWIGMLWYFVSGRL